MGIPALLAHAGIEHDGDPKTLPLALRAACEKLGGSEFERLMEMTEDEEKYQPGWFVGGYLDDSISQEMGEAVRGALIASRVNSDPDEFIQWLGSELAEFRNLSEIKEGLHSFKQDIDSVRNLEESVQSVIESLGAMSPNLDSRLSNYLSNVGHSESDVARRVFVNAVISTLTELQFSLIRVESGLLSDRPGRGGRPANIDRDRLLSKVKERLISDAGKQADVGAAAADILKALGFDAPQDGRVRQDKRTPKGDGKN